MLGIPGLPPTCDLGFTEAKSNTFLFIYHQGAAIAYILLYVDDVILIASSVELLQQVISSLQSEFLMKDLGTLHHFLGITVERRDSGLFLHQRTYLLDIIERAGLRIANQSPLQLIFKQNYQLMSDILFRTLPSFAVWLELSNISPSLVLT